MPPVSRQQLESYRTALAMRDNGSTYQQIATYFGLNSPSNGRNLVNQGLRRAGRESEIRTRTITISHNGRTTTTTVETQIGFTMLQDLTFGVEFEIINASCNDAERIMTSAGFNLYNNGYNHDVMPVWKVVTDASLSSRTSNCEVVSPVLQGSDGLSEIRTVAKVLRDAGASVNSSCGMHIHIGIDGLIDIQQQAHVIVAHQQWSCAFDALLVESRINASWAKKIDRDSAFEIAGEWAQSTNLRAGNSDLTHNRYRYRALNLAAFAKYGTFEFRSHQGSLNGLNATAWIAFHTAFIKAAHLFSDEMNNAARLLSAANPDSTVWTATMSSIQNRGGVVSRAAQTEACKYLATRLVELGLLDEACANHIINRAGNIPARSNNQ